MITLNQLSARAGFKIVEEIVTPEGDESLTTMVQEQQTLYKRCSQIKNYINT